jgi:hypothetical protein
MLLAGMVMLSGCVRVLAIGAKVFLGDPAEQSLFERQTGMELQSGEHEVALVVDVPHLVSDEFGSLAIDLHDEIAQRLRKHGIVLADPDAVVRSLEAGGRDFSANRLARDIDADCIVHVQVEAYTDTRTGNASLLQSESRGLVTAYEIRGEYGSADRHAVSVYEQPFESTYPSGHPLTAEQTPRKKFILSSVRDIADDVGRHFYDVPTRDLY